MNLTATIQFETLLKLHRMRCDELTTMHRDGEHMSADQWYSTRFGIREWEHNQGVTSTGETLLTCVITFENYITEEDVMLFLLTYG